MAIGIYNGKTLETYLQEFDGHTSFPIFTGLEPFTELREKGWLRPRWSMIRLMSGDGAYDEHYTITEEFQLEGISAERHSGEEGEHDPAIILKDDVRWEAQRLRRT